jgi:predicted RNA-binding protein
MNMCESNVYLIDKQGHEKLLLESVDRITPEGDNIQLESIFSQRMSVKARIKEMTLVQHRIVLEERD